MICTTGYILFYSLKKPVYTEIASCQKKIENGFVLLANKLLARNQLIQQVLLTSMFTFDKDITFSVVQRASTLERPELRKALNGQQRSF